MRDSCVTRANPYLAMASVSSSLMDEEGVEEVAFSEEEEALMLALPPLW